MNIEDEAICLFFDLSLFYDHRPFGLYLRHQRSSTSSRAILLIMT